MSDNIERVYDSLHHILHENNQIVEKEVNLGDIDEYVLDLIDKVLSNDESRIFNLSSDTTEVNTLILRILKSEDKEVFINNTRKIANRLLRIEKTTQERYQQLTNLKKGSLIQSYLKNDNLLYYFIAKVEHEAFLDEDYLKKQMGLPYDKRILKTGIFVYNMDLDISDIYVSDSNSTMAKYWWESFLELVEMNSDTTNTKESFNSIERLLKRKVKKQSPTDYNIIRNNLIGYFKTQEQFSFDTMIQNVFGSYEPEQSDKINIEELKIEVNKLPEKHKFDRVFNLVPKEINARIKRNYEVSSGITLQIKDHIEDIRDKIILKSDLNENPYLKIKVDNPEEFKEFDYNEE